MNEVRPLCPQTKGKGAWVNLALWINPECGHEREGAQYPKNVLNVWSLEPLGPLPSKDKSGQSEEGQ